MGDWVEHGDGVYSRTYPSLTLNVGAIDCGTAMLVIDTRAHLGQARELMADLRRLTPLPVGWVVNTHHHWDHTFGNAAFLPVPIWGHERCAVLLSAEGEQMRDEVADSWPGPDGRLIGEVPVTPPDHTFTEATTIVCGERTVDLRFLGRGHTDNDIVVAAPGTGVVFAGDLIEESAPPVYGDAYPLEWPAAAAALLELDWVTAVPGHGVPVDREFVAAQAAEIAEVARLAVERHAAGFDPNRAAAGGGPFGAATLRKAFERAWQHLEAGPA